MHADDSRRQCLEKFAFALSLRHLRIRFTLDMVLCGSPHSGKSTAAILMIDVLTQMQQQQQLQSLTPQQKSNSIAQEANYAQEVAGQTHKLYR